MNNRCSTWRTLIGNWHEVAGWLMSERLHREVVVSGQSEASLALLDELLAYPDVPRAWWASNWAIGSAPVWTLDMVKDGLILCLFSIITTLDALRDITLQELKPESFSPADEAMEEFLWVLWECKQAASGDASPDRKCTLIQQNSTSLSGELSLSARRY